MAITFGYAASATLSLVAKRLLDRTSAKNPFMSRIPVRETNDSLVVWERETPTWGLMQGRGFNGAFPEVPGLGSARVTMDPGAWGELLPIDELELTRRAQAGTFATPIAIGDLVNKRVMQGMSRAYNRMIVHYVTLLTTGNYVAYDAKGSVIYQDAYTPQTYIPANLWSNATASTPQQDFRNIQLLDLGVSVSFDSSAYAVMNQFTYNAFITNQNTADLFGRKNQYGATINSLDDLNYLQQRDNLPLIAIFNDSYMDNNNTAQRYLPNGYVVIMGKRADDAPLGEFLLTRNVNNRDNSSKILAHVKDDPETFPRKVEVITGYNGGIAIYQPESIVVAKVL